MRDVGWTGGYVSCKSRCCCLSPLFGEEMRVWVQWGKNHISLSLVKQLTWKDCFQHLWNLKDTPLYFGGTLRLPADGVVLLGGVSEETAGCGFLWSYPWLVFTLMGFSPGDGQEPGAHVRTSPSWSALCPGHIRHISCNNPSRGKQFEIRQTGEQLPRKHEN